MLVDWTLVPFDVGQLRIARVSAPCASHLDVERGLLGAARDVEPHVDAEAPGDEITRAGTVGDHGVRFGEALRTPGPAAAEEADQRPASRRVPAQLGLRDA